jgi:hypothetical protein
MDFKFTALGLPDSSLHARIGSGGDGIDEGNFDSRRISTLNFVFLYSGSL